MNDTLGIKQRAPLFISLATNVFLVAFVLGRLSGPGVLPPPHAWFDDHGMLPPPEMHHHDHGPPPFLGPDSLFSPDEMKADEQRMRQDFNKMSALRQDFAARLKTGPVAKEDVLKHFTDLDQIMDGVRKEAQQKAAEKISAMSPEERQKFVHMLMERGDPPSQPDR